jgi:hypothetical protein
MKDKDVNINVVRSVWRRTKKGHIQARDLKPQKDVKGGGGVAGFVKISGSIAEVPPQISYKPPLSSRRTPHWLHQLRAARDAMIRKLFEIPAEPERKAQAERTARVRRVFLQWLKKGKK